MELTIEVIAAAMTIIAVAGERAAELFGSAIFAALKSYGINVTSKDVRTVIMVLLVTVFNFALFYGLDLDILAKLLEENSTYVTVALAAFAASGLSGLSHSIIQFLGKKGSLLEIIEDSVDLGEELTKPEA